LLVFPQGLKLLKWAESAEKEKFILKLKKTKVKLKTNANEVLISLPSCEISE